METTTPTMHRHFTGLVTKVGMMKTVVARVDTMKLNTKYQKKHRVSKTFHVHDETNVAKVGDTITFVECRPLSKTKRWRLVKIAAQS